MKIVILGGAGGQGLYATKEIIKGKVFDEIVVASRNLEKTQKVIDGLNADNVTAAQVDVTNKKELLELIKDADVLANCTGPYYLLGKHVVEAAIEAGVNYVDFCDDVVVHKELFSKDYDKKAKEKGISMIIGLGASPGIMPMLAYMLAKDFDTVDVIDIYLTIDVRDDADGPAVLLHVIENFVDDIDVVRDGKAASEKPFEGGLMVDFKGPIGEAYISTMGHPEVFTLPRVLPEAQNITVKLGLFPSKEFENLKILIESGMAADKDYIVNGEKVSVRDFLVEHLIETIDYESKRDFGEDMTATLVRIKGMKDNKEIEVKDYHYSKMGPATGYPLAIGAEWLAKGKIKKKGLMVPEECLDTVPFLLEYKNRISDEGLISLGSRETIIKEITSGQEYYDKFNFD